MGRQLFSFDCSEASNITVLKQQLSGLVQSGCWTLFSNIQHMNAGKYIQIVFTSWHLETQFCGIIVTINTTGKVHIWLRKIVKC